MGWFESVLPAANLACGSGKQDAGKIALENQNAEPSSCMVDECRQDTTCANKCEVLGAEQALITRFGELHICRGQNEGNRQ